MLMDFTGTTTSRRCEGRPQEPTPASWYARIPVAVAVGDAGQAAARDSPSGSALPPARSTPSISSSKCPTRALRPSKMTARPSSASSTSRSSRPQGLASSSANAHRHRLNLGTAISGPDGQRGVLAPARDYAPPNDAHPGGTWHTPRWPQSRSTVSSARSEEGISGTRRGVGLGDRTRLAARWRPPPRRPSPALRLRRLVAAGGVKRAVRRGARAHAGRSRGRRGAPSSNIWGPSSWRCS